MGGSQTIDGTSGQGCVAAVAVAMVSVAVAMVSVAIDGDGGDGDGDGGGGARCGVVPVCLVCCGNSFEVFRL